MRQPLLLIRVLSELSKSEQCLAQKWGVALLQEEPFDPGAGLVTHWELDGLDAGVQRSGE